MKNLGFFLRFYYLLCFAFLFFNHLSLAVENANDDGDVALPDYDIVALSYNEENSHSEENSTLTPDFENVTSPIDRNVTLPFDGNVTLPFDGNRSVVLDEVAAIHLNLMEKNMTPYVQDSVQKQWDYNTDITDETEEAMNEASVAFSSEYQAWWENLISGYNYQDLSMYYRRQFEMQQSIDTAILSEDDLNDLNEHINNMVGYYGSKVCPWDDKKCDEDDDGFDIDKLEVEMATNEDYSELLYYWEKWRDASGKEMIDDFKDYVELMNKTAIANGFDDAGMMWIEPYTTYEEAGYNSTDFKTNIEDLWTEVKPLYQKLYAYVRYRLKQNDDYEQYFDDSDLIPAHILGNMWAQSWENIYDQVTPYKDTPLPDISETLETRNNVTEMFKIAEDFFTSMGMFKMTQDFWDNSMMEQPEGKEVVCHASAWDFYSTGDDNVENGKYRIKMCTNTNQDDFIVIHHEMGHVEYYMSYANDTPIIYRDGANPGFHEAIGDTIALAVSTPSHLQFIEDTLNGLTQLQTSVKEEVNKTQQNINYLMKQALAKVAFLPYAYILDSWRWGVFNGSIEPDEYNKKWWEMRIDYQGLRPPISRSPKSDFDIGCKYHVAANVPYIRYFVAHILQFQFYEQLCKVSGNTEDLFNCDFYGSTDAGDALRGMLSKGASVQWQEQLSEFLGTDGNMDASAIINYFQPLSDFLDKEIANNEIDVTWPESSEVIDDYMRDTEQISAAVPITVGIVLAVLICIVLVAFFFGQRKRKMQEDKAMEKKKEAELERGNVNNGIELEETKDEYLKEEKNKEELKKEVKEELKKEKKEEEEEEEDHKREFDQIPLDDDPALQKDDDGDEDLKI